MGTGALAKRGVAVWTHAVVEQRRFELPRGLVNHRGTCLEGLGTWPGRAREAFMFLILAIPSSASASLPRMTPKELPIFRTVRVVFIVAL